MKILILEDSHAADDLAEMLRDESYQVKPCANFADAMYELFESDMITPTCAYDALIIDLMMPIMHLPENIKNEIKAKHYPPGWAFYRFLEKADNFLINNTIFYTAFPDRLLSAAIKDSIDHETLKIIQKNSIQPIIDQAMRLLRNCNRRNRGD